jgi:tRNA(Ile)-lysidine synthase
MGFALEAAHFNHGIRAEAGEDERFVAAACERLGVKLSAGRADVPALARASGVSVEVAGREARHAFFRDAMRERGLSRLALAHHRDDQAETVLLRLVRGAGTAGLGAMAPAEESGIVRPLLCVGRADIRKYCEENNIAWREDATNADRSIPRNLVRREVMPLLGELNPSAADALCRAAELLREDEDFLTREAEKALEGAEARPGGGLSVAAGRLAALHPALKTRALRLLLARAGLEKDVERVNISAVCALLGEGMTGRRVDLDGGFAALREAEDIVIVPGLPEAPAYAPAPLRIPGETHACGGVFRCEVLGSAPPDYTSHPAHIQYLDLDALPANAVARGRLPGDRFRPLNAPGGRKLKECLIDKKLPRWGRDALPLVASGPDVLWAVGLAIADSVKITGKTRRVLKISYTAGEGEA